LPIKTDISINYTLWLWIFTALFCFRITAQLLVANFEIGFLPPFDSWHSGTMPYLLLLFIQIVILSVMVRTNYRYSSGKMLSNPVLGKGLLIFGIIYLLVMLIRLGLGLTVFSENRWFGNYIPTFFHLVLASWILMIGRFIYK
jgi:hypothetical protein